MRPQGQGWRFAFAGASLHFNFDAVCFFRKVIRPRYVPEPLAFFRSGALAFLNHSIRKSFAQQLGDSHSLLVRRLASEKAEKDLLSQLVQRQFVT